MRELETAPGARQDSTPVFQSLRTRGWIVACFYLTVAASLPFWLQTTSIERLSLPRDRVAAWEARLPCPIRFQHRLELNLPSDAPLRIEDHEDVVDEIVRRLRAAGDGVLSPRVVDAEASPQISEGDLLNASTPAVKAWPKALENAACIDWDLRIGPSHNEGQSYRVIYGQAGSFKDESVNNSTRSILLPWIEPRQGSKVPEIAHVLSTQLANVLELPYRSSFARLDQTQSQEVTATPLDQTLVEQAETDKRRVPFTKNVRLVFSLVNEDMAASRQSNEAIGVEGWDAREVGKAFANRIDPLLDSLKRTHAFTTELQAIWFAPLQFQPKTIQLPVKNQTAVDEAIAIVSPSDTTEQDVNDTLVERQEEDAATLEALSLGKEPTSPAKGQDVHLIDWNDLQIFVHAGEWGLSTGGAAAAVDASMLNSTDDSSLEQLHAEHERTLHFVLYVPQPKHRPLRVAGDADATTVSPAMGWLIPQWGGVSLYNLGYEESADAVTRALSGQATIRSLTADELDPAFATFEKQLRSLLGVKPRSHAEGAAAEGSRAEISSATRDALALDALVRRRTLETSRESVQTLASIVRLVDKIKVLSVDEQVRNDVSASLKLLEEADALTAAPEAEDHGGSTRAGASPLDAQDKATTTLAPLAPLSALLDLTYASMLLSSRAFFNPRMLGQLYFPEEHKYAVYTPLFGPLAVPLLVAGLRLIKERRTKKKHAATASPGTSTPKSKSKTKGGSSSST